MRMSPEQRAAAIERMAEADYLSGRRASPRPWSELTATHRSDYRRTAAAALDALTEEFVVLHKDDVTEDHKIKWGGEDGCEPIRTSKRLITRWEPITNPTKEDKNA